MKIQIRLSEEDPGMGGWLPGWLDIHSTVVKDPPRTRKKRSRCHRGDPGTSHPSPVDSFSFSRFSVRLTGTETLLHGDSSLFKDVSGF